MRNPQLREIRHQLPGIVERKAPAQLHPIARPRRPIATPTSRRRTHLIRHAPTPPHGNTASPHAAPTNPPLLGEVTTTPSASPVAHSMPQPPLTRAAATG